MENEIVELYLDDIIPNRFQPREVFDDQALKELAISIREHGVIQPILVRKFGEKYEIIAGERRYKASTMAGLTKIPAIVKNLDDKESSKVALIENLQRRDLTPIEEARTYQKILDLDEMTQEQLASTMGKSQSAVSNKLRLLSLPDEIQEALLKGEISERHARSLLNVEDKNLQVQLLKKIVDNKIPVRELDAQIKSLNSSRNTEQETETNNNNNTLPNENYSDKNMNNNQSSNDDIFSKPEIISITDTSENLFTANNLLNENDLDSNDKNNEVNSADSNENILFSNNTGVDNMNSDNLFENSPNNSDVIEPVQFTTDDNNSLFNDPTTVNIDKIREQSNDINFNLTEEKKDLDFKNLLQPSGSTITNEDTSNRFIPDFEDTTIEKTEDGNEVIGNGLLAGMPVIKPVESNVFNSGDTNLNDITKNDSNNNTINNNSNDSIFGQNDNSALDSSINAININQNHNTEENNTSSLFNNTPDENNTSNDTSSLFSSSIPEKDTVAEKTIQTNSLFETSEQLNTNLQSEVDISNNFQLPIDDVKNIIKTYQDKGYVISVEELNLDREIQLIIKINKN